jgi:HD-GYP domain-containing protein (c-di-GMP phosphodiesterase class II)
MFNPAYAAFMRENYGIDIAVGQSATDFMPSEDAGFWSSLYNQAKEKGVFHYQYQAKNVDKTINFKLVVLAHGKQDASILVFGEDISTEIQNQKGIEEANRKLSIQLRESISAISKIGELRDVFTAGHQRKVQALACAIAEELHCSDETRNNIYMGSLILDIGKVGIPSDMINKPGKLSDLEFKIMMTHAQMGYNIANEISFSPDVPTMIFQHHERLDGSGYPQGLKGDQILLESRILAVCDVVEAMCSHRPYRSALGIKAALDEITSHSGTKYDPVVVKTCVRLFEEKSFKFPVINF